MLKSLYTYVYNIQKLLYQQNSSGGGEQMTVGWLVFSPEG